MVSRLRREDTILMVVDVQERLVPAMSDAERLVAGCTLLARTARRLELPVLLTEQNPARLGPTVAPLADVLEARPFAKMLFSACTDEVTHALRATGRHTVLLCGIEAHVCVAQSALDLLDAGYTVFVADDAITSRRESDKSLGWKRMMRAGALPTSVEGAVFELLREAGTPDFKALLPFIK